MILALGVFYSGIVSLNQYSKEYSTIRRETKKRNRPYLVLFFLKSAGLTALAADSGKMVMYSASSFCFSGLINFETAFVCILGSVLTAGASSFFALIDERYLIYLVLGFGGIMRFIVRKSHRESLKLFAMFIFSIGILLFGIILIKDNFAFIGKNDYVKHVIMTIHNPFLMVLIGTVIAFIMQSTAGFSFMIVGLLGSNLISYEQSILMLYGSCISSSIKNRLYALPFKGSARRLMFANANIILASSVITVGLYFLERVTSIPLLNSLLRDIYRNVIFEVSGAVLVVTLFIVLLSLIFLKPLVRLYTKLYPDDIDESLTKAHYIQNIESIPESEWLELMNKEVDRIIVNLHTLVDVESPKGLVNSKNVCDSNILIFDRIMDLHKYITERVKGDSLEEYLLYEKVFFLINLNKRLIRYCDIIRENDSASENIFKHAVSAHILLVIRCLSDFVCKKTDIREVEIVAKTLNYNTRKIEIFDILKDIKSEHYMKFELASIYSDILTSLSGIISSYEYPSNDIKSFHSSDTVL